MIVIPVIAVIFLLLGYSIMKSHTTLFDSDQNLMSKMRSLFYRFFKSDSNSSSINNNKMGNGASMASSQHSLANHKSQLGKYPVHPIDSGSQSRSRSSSNISTDRYVDVEQGYGYSVGSSRSKSSRRVTDMPNALGGSINSATKSSNIYFENNSNKNNSSSSNSSSNVSSVGSVATTDKTATNAAKGEKLCCDKCDGNHETDKCPYFKKPRENHPDAQKNFYKKLGGTSVLPGALLRNASVVRQPGDGSCLYHSMSYGLKGKNNADRLRSEICAFVKDNPQYLISDVPLSDWVKWDSGSSVSDYSRKMSRGAWGGGIEMAVTSHIKQCNIHVYEANRDGYKRISAFDYPDKPEDKPVIRVIYRGGVHYDALVA